MAKTLMQLTKKIEELQKEADRVRASEVAGVVKRIKDAIAFYGLTPADLFGTATRATRKNKKTAGRKTKARAPSVAKYRDKESGKTWTGHGKRPRWYVDAVARGVKPEDMAV